MATTTLSTKQRVMQALENNGRNPRLAAETTGVTLRYAQMLLNELKVKDRQQPQELAPGPATQLLEDIMPRNVTEMCALRDDVITKLKSLIEKIDDPGMLLTILETVLKYESKVREVAQPSVNFLDNRTQIQHNNFGGLIDALKEVDRDKLHILSGVPKAIPFRVDDNIIEGEVADGK